MVSEISRFCDIFISIQNFQCLFCMSVRLFINAYTHRHTCKHDKNVIVAERYRKKILIRIETETKDE